MTLRAKYLNPANEHEIAQEMDVPPIHLYVALSNSIGSFGLDTWVIMDTATKDYDVTWGEEFVQCFKFVNFLQKGWIEVSQVV